MSPPEGHARWAGRLVALALLLPALLHLWARGGEGWWLVLAALAAPRLIGGRDDARVWAVGLAFTFALPLWPVILGQFGFGLERVLVYGALACLAWRGALHRTPCANPRVRAARWLLGIWAAWSVGAALRGFWVNLPEGAPWVGDLFLRQVFESLTEHSMVEPSHPLQVLLLRLEVLLVIWSGLELALRRPELGRLFGRYAVGALLFGVLTAIVELGMGASFRGEAYFDQFREGIGRMHRPLNDHNSLGSALVLLLPLLGWVALRDAVVRAPRRLVFSGAAFVLAVLLLITTRSKAALGATALCALVLGAWSVWAWVPRLRGKLLFLVGAGALCLVALNLAPERVTERLAQVKVGADAVRLARGEALLSYLRDQRFAVWSGGFGMVREAPLLGVGLGNFPRRLADFRDADSPASFNPLHENAHNQWLQVAAEEGLVGLALFGALFALALWGGLRAAREARELGPLERAEPIVRTAALFALGINLLVGHSLLVPAAGLLAAAFLGPLLAGGARAGEDYATRVRWTGPALALAALVVGAAPALWTARPPLESHALGVFPWYVTSDGVRVRALAQDARWMQPWGEGSRMVLGLQDLRPPIFEGPQHVDVYLDGELVWEGRELERAVQENVGNPLNPFLLDAPPGVQAGDLVELRIVSALPFAESKAFYKGQAIACLRTAEPFFKTPGSAQ